MSKRILTVAGIVLALAATPAIAQEGTADQDRRTPEADDRAGQPDRSAGEAIDDTWIHAKIKAQFVGEDALEGSDIDVDVKNRVVTLKGHVASQVGRDRAAELARTTEGVTKVKNKLKIGVAENRDRDEDRPVGTSGRDTVEVDDARDVSTSPRVAGDEARDEMQEGRDEAKDESAEAAQEGREAARETREEAREAAEETRDAVGTAGEAVSDGWITAKVKSSFVGVDVLEGSDIDVDTDGQVVTLTGTVASEAARRKAVELAKDVDGVKSVKDELEIAAKQ